LKQRQAQENAVMEVEPEMIEVIDSKGRRSMIEAPIEEPIQEADEQMIEL